MSLGPPLSTALGASPAAPKATDSTLNYRNVIPDLDRCLVSKAESPRMDRSWEHRSACKGIDPVIFYPATEEEAARAKEVCAVCPVQTDCLEYAIAAREHEGVWGGHTERERQRIIRRRRRQRALNKTSTTVSAKSNTKGAMEDRESGSAKVLSGRVASR